MNPLHNTGLAVAALLFLGVSSASGQVAGVQVDRSPVELDTAATQVEMRLTGTPITPDAPAGTAAATRLAFAQQPTSTAAGETIDPPVTIQLKDWWYNNVRQAGVSVTLKITTGTGTLSGTLTRETDDNGLAAFDDLSIDLIGSKRVTASSEGLESARSRSFSIKLGPPARLSIRQEPSETAIAGEPFPSQPEVLVLDAGGNLVASDEITEVTASRLTGKGTLQGTVTVTARDGVASFANLSHNVAGGITLLFESGQLIGDTSSVVLVQPAAAARLAFLQQPVNTMAGAMIAPPVSVRLKDAFGNDVGLSGTQVTLSLTGGSGTLGGTLTRSTVSGVATFADLSIDLAGSKVLTAASGTLTPAISNPFVITAREAHALAFLQQPTGSEAAIVIAPPVTVQLRDSIGNDVPLDSVEVTLQIAAGSGVLNGTATRMTDETGLATFDDLSIDRAGQKTLRAVSGDLTPDLSSEFVITPRRESKLAFVEQPSSAIAGRQITPAVAVQLRDSLGNDVAKPGISIVIALTPGSTGTLSGTTLQLTDASGRATFGNLSINLIGVKTLTAVASGTDRPVSDAFIISPAPPSRLVFTRHPSGSTAGVPFPVQPAVELQDQYQNRVSGAAQEVTIAIHANPGHGGVLSGATTVPLDTLTGTAQFSDLSIDRSGSGYTLMVTGSTVSTIPGAVVSDRFDIAAAPATKVRVETEAHGAGTILGTQSVSSGTSVTVHAIARDAFDNFVADTAATGWSLLSISGGVVQADLVVAADRRSATFTGAAVGSAVISASVAGLTSVPSGTITVVNNATATRIFVETAANGAGSVVRDQTLTSGGSMVFYAIARDLNNNFVSNVTADAWSLVDPSPGISPEDLVSDGDGRSAVLTGRLAGTTRVRAIFGDLIPEPTGLLTITAGTPSVVAATAGTPQSATVGSTFNTRLAAKVTDAAGNPLGGVPVTFDVPFAGASGTFELGLNTVVTDTVGVALAPAFTANTVAGTYTVTARTSGASIFAAFQLTNSARDAGRITAVGGTPQSARVGTAFPVRFVASVQDSFGNPVRGAEITFTAPAEGAAGTFPGGAISATVATSDDGIGTAPLFTANSVAGRYAVSVTAPGLLAPALYALSNTASSAASVSPIVGNQQATEVNTPFSTRFKAAVRDTWGNSVSGVPITFVSPPEGPGGEFPWGDSITVTTDTSGVAEAPLFIANTVAGMFTVTARAEGLAALAVFELTNVPAAVSGFRIEALGGGPIPPQMARVPFDVRVSAQDRFGNTATDFGGTVNLSASGVLVQGAGPTPPFEGGVLPRHTVALQNAGRIVLLALRTGGAEGGNSDTVQVNNPVPVALALSPSTGARGESLTLKVTGSGFLQGVTTVILGNNITTYETAASDSEITVALNIGSDAFEGARTVLVINPPPGGGIATIESGFFVEGISYPGTYVLQNTYMFPTHPQNSDYQATDYRIVGLPGAANVSISHFLSGSKDQDWAVYWDNGDSAGYLVPFDGTDMFSTSPGRAFWLLQRGPLAIDTIVPTAPLDTTGSVEIPLHRGWNLIANPFTFPVAWSDVQSVNDAGAMGGVYTFEGAFLVPNVLDPFEGCIYDNAGGMPSLRIPLREARLSRPKEVALDSWTIGLEFRVGDYVERLLSFGVSPGAENGRDNLDWRRPRGVGNLPEVFFIHPEWGHDGGAFATDIRRSIGDVQTWQLVVRSTPRHSIRLSFTAISSVPEEYDVILVDDARARSVDLRAVPVYEFAPATPVSHFRIVVGTESGTRGLLEQMVPDAFALGSNYPNPFNPSTTIPVTVPRASSVALRIYSILGELVRTLHVGPLEAGRHSFVWDGRSDHGSAVSAGTYVVRLSVEGGQRFTGKMVLVR